MTLKNLLIALCLFTLTIKGQPVSVNELDYKLSDTVQGAYHPATTRNFIFIASRFGSAEVDQSRVLDSVSGFLIKEIVLVYSRYKQSDDFNQAKLNKARWTNLLLKYPSLFQDGTTLYGDICQSGIENDSLARELTHGFYIYYENRADPEERAKEIAAISKMMEEMGIDTSEVDKEVPKTGEEVVPVKITPGHPRYSKPLRAKDPKDCRQAYYGKGLDDLNAFFRAHIPLSNKQKKNYDEITAEVRLRLDFNGQIKSAHVLSTSNEFIEQVRKALAQMTLWHPAVLNGIAINTTVMFNLQCTAGGYVKLKGDLVPARALRDCGQKTDEEIFDFSEKKSAGTAIPSVFEVNDKTLLKNVTGRHAELDSLLLVVDLTGSMGPYIAQVLSLMEELVSKNDKRILSIVLFNDGNGKADRSKKIGKTGGITVLKGEITLDGLGEAVLTSMHKGNGGDVMENNIEAVLEGLGACPGCRNVMLIADNFATPRDGILLEKVDRPIHWVLCGAYNGINSNYLDLIRLNKGFLHTNQADAANLHEVQEEEIVNIAGFNYQLKNGKFRMVESR